MKAWWAFNWHLQTAEAVALNCTGHNVGKMITHKSRVNITDLVLKWAENLWSNEINRKHSCSSILGPKLYIWALNTQSIFFSHIFFPWGFLACPGVAPWACTGAARGAALASSAQPGHVGFGGFWEPALSLSVSCGFTPRPHKLTLNFRFKWTKNHSS